MPAALNISVVTFGGTAANNPPNYSTVDYRDYPNLDLTKNYVRMNIVHVDVSQSITRQVTGLVMVNAQGSLMMGPSDKVFVPCPPYCE